MVAKFFNREHVNSLKPFITATVDSFLDNLVKKGCDSPVNFIEHFSLPIPTLVCRGPFPRSLSLPVSQAFG
jgi:nitric oxide reductase